MYLLICLTDCFWSWTAVARPLLYGSMTCCLCNWTLLLLDRQHVLDPYASCWLLGVFGIFSNFQNRPHYNQLQAGRLWVCNSTLSFWRESSSMHFRVAGLCMVQIMVPGRTNVSLTLSWSTEFNPIAAAQQPGAAKPGPKGDADSEVTLSLSGPAIGTESYCSTS